MHGYKVYKASHIMFVAMGKFRLNKKHLGLVVRKPINANPWLKVNLGLNLAHLMRFLKANLKLIVNTKSKN